MRASQNLSRRPLSLTRFAGTSTCKNLPHYSRAQLIRHSLSLIHSQQQRHQLTRHSSCSLFTTQHASMLVRAQPHYCRHGTCSNANALGPSPQSLSSSYLWTSPLSSSSLLSSSLLSSLSSLSTSSLSLSSSSQSTLQNPAGYTLLYGPLVDNDFVKGYRYYLGGFYAFWFSISLPTYAGVEFFAPIASVSFALHPSTAPPPLPPTSTPFISNLPFSSAIILLYIPLEELSEILSRGSISGLRLSLCLSLSFFLSFFLFLNLYHAILLFNRMNFPCGWHFHFTTGISFPFALHGESHYII